MSVYEYDYTSLEGEKVSMRDYEGKVMLLVNTASKCGFAPQFQGLEELYRKYGDQGFTVIGFPSNQFMDQEPGGREEIAQGCQIRYGVSFPMADKADVRGQNALPLFRHLTLSQRFKGVGKGFKAKAFEMMMKARYKDGYDDPEIKWNFTKFLVDRQGRVVNRYEPLVEPKEIAPDIEKLL